MNVFNDRHIIIFKERDEKLYNLILDLDQTLIHTKIIYNPDKDTINSEKNLCKFTLNNYCHTVYTRKNLFSFLNSLKEHYNIYIYTDGTDEYALNIYYHLNKNAENAIVGIISRNSKNHQKPLTPKNLDILPCFDILNTIIIDDRHDVWHKNSLRNLIQIKEYIYDPEINHDEHLDALRDLLITYKENMTDELFHDIIHEINTLYNFFDKLSISKFAVNILKYMLGTSSQ
jgi:TFIIF-interacting CTD phosphatase-like protein